MVDALGNPLKYEVTAGNINDCVTGYEILQTLDVEGKNVIADRGYDTDKIIELLEENQANSVIPSVNIVQFNVRPTWWVFFSTPLDIDFLMLENYFEGYLSQLESGEGPNLKIGKTNKKIHKLDESDRKSDEYKKRLKLDIACTLKNEDKEGQYYSDQQKEMMIWYKYLFLYRGKPSTHMKMLAQIEDKVLQVTLPSVFSRMADVIKTKL
ncbi:transposase [Brevibacillus laterosporus]|uniref:transposase n=1 Tax=Brevibacillus laterosporus TaxID=1465 RepID=UPI000370F545|nr:transposase [Brevibacillus laterosporus]MED4765869.1 transposase [Brevibacillus laterosporus]